MHQVFRPKALHLALLLVLLICQFLVPAPVAGAPGRDDAGSTPAAGQAVMGPQDLPELVTPPPAGLRTRVDPTTPGWATSYGTEYARQASPPRAPAAYEQTPAGPSPETGFGAMNLSTVPGALGLGISGLAPAPDGRLFAVVGSGLWVYAPQASRNWSWSQITTYAGTTPTALAVFRDELWVATLNGIRRMSLDSGTWLTTFTTAAGLPSNLVRGLTIVTDDPWLLGDYAWAVTDGGPARYRLKALPRPGQSPEWLWETPPNDAQHVFDSDVESVTVQQYGGYTYTWFAMTTLFERTFVRWRRAGVTTGWDGVWAQVGDVNCALSAEKGVVDGEGYVWFDAVIDQAPHAASGDGSEPAAPAAEKRDVGICRYDPAHNTWQRLSKSSSQGDFPPLLDNTVNDLAIDAAGRVWIATPSGVMGFDPQGCQGRGTWITFQAPDLFQTPVTRIGVAGDAVWFGHPGRAGYNAGLTQRSLPWQNYVPGSGTGSGPLILTASAVLVGADMGYMEGTVASGNVMNWTYRPIPGNASSVAYLGVKANGELIAGTHGSGAFFQSGAAWTHYGTAEGLPSNDVRSALEDRYGRRWVATAAGLAVRDHGYWMVFTHANSGLAANTLTALTLDDQDRIWIGTADQGISVLNPDARGSAAWVNYTTANGLPSNTINGLATGQDGKVWAATGDGVAGWTPTSGAWQRWSVPTAALTEAAGVSAGAIPALAVNVDPLGRVWVGTGAGLAVREGTTWRMLRGSESSLYNDRVTSVAGDADYVWSLSANTLHVRNHNPGPIGYCTPQITSLSADHAAPGAQVTINGSGFDGRGPSYNRVRFHPLVDLQSGSAPTEARVISAEPGKLVIEVPELARHSAIRVTSHDLTSQPSARFDIDPEIRSSNVGCLGPGETLSLYGVGFMGGGSYSTWVKIGSGAWRLADRWDPKLVQVNLRAGETSGAVQVKVSDQPGAYVASVSGLQLATPQVTSANVQQGIQGLRLIWGKETMIQVKVRVPAGCTAYIDDATFTWKRNGQWLTPAVGGIRKPGGGPIKVPDSTTTAFSEDKDVTMTGGWYMHGLFPLSEFGGARVYLRRGGVTIATYDIPASTFNFLDTASAQKVMIVEVHPPDYWNHPGLHANAENLAKGLAAAARIWPQQDHDPSGYNNVYNHWLIYPMDISFTSATCNLDDEDTREWFHETFRDFLAEYNDNCAGECTSGFVQRIFALCAGELYGGGTPACSFDDSWVSVGHNLRQNQQDLTGRYIAHEIGHSWGLVDPDAANYDSGNPAKGHSRYDDGHPGDTCVEALSLRQANKDWLGGSRQIWGFGTGGCSSSPAAQRAHSVMSYAAGRENDNLFFEPLDYNHLISWATHPVAVVSADTSAATTSLRLNGSISPADQVAVTLSRVIPLLRDLTPAEASGPYRLVIHRGDGTLAHSQYFTPSWADNDGNRLRNGQFALRVPFPSGSTRVQIRKGSAVLWQATVSARAPLVTLSQPTAGAYQAASGVPVRWTASDPDGDALQVDLEYSPDDGATWIPVNELRSTPYTWYPGFAQTTTKARVRVRASDGFSVTYATSPRFTLTGRPPIAVIQAPLAGAVFMEGQTAALKGDSITPAGPGAGTFTWKLDGATIGTGRQISATLANVGTRTIRLDLAQGGLTDSASVQVTVLKDYDGDGLPNDWELAHKLNPMDFSNAGADADGDGLDARAEYDLGADPTRADTDGDGVPDGVEAELGTRPDDPSQQPATGPVLLVGGNQVTFTHQRGSSLPQAHERYITNGGLGSLSFTVTDDAAWLSATPAQGSAPGKLTITANPAGKPPGSYTGRVTVSAAGAAGSPQVITVTLRVSAGAMPTYLPLIMR